MALGKLSLRLAWFVRVRPSYLQQLNSFAFYFIMVRTLYRRFALITNFKCLAHYCWLQVQGCPVNI